MNQDERANVLLSIVCAAVDGLRQGDKEHSKRFRELGKLEAHAEQVYEMFATPDDRHRSSLLAKRCIEVVTKMMDDEAATDKE